MFFHKLWQQNPLNSTEIKPNYQVCTLISSPWSYTTCKFSRQATTSFIFGRFFGRSSTQRLASSVIATASRWPKPGSPTKLWWTSEHPGLNSFKAHKSSTSLSTGFPFSTTFLLIKFKSKTPNAKTSDLTLNVSAKYLTKYKHGYRVTKRSLSRTDKINNNLRVLTSQVKWHMIFYFIFGNAKEWNTSKITRIKWNHKWKGNIKK